MEKVINTVKAAVIVMRMATTSLSALVIYQLTRLILQDNPLRSSEISEYLTVIEPISRLVEPEPISLQGLRPSEEFVVNTLSASSILPQVVPPVATNQPKERKGKKNLLSSIPAPLLLQEDIAKALALVQIDIKPALREELSVRPSGKEWLSQVENMVFKIRTVLPQTMQPTLLLKILKDPTFSVELVAYNDPGLTRGGKAMGANAHYLPISNKILIVIDADKSDREILTLLRNEMHHVAIRYTNFAKQSVAKKNLPEREKSIKILCPAIKDGWETNPMMAALHRKALKAGFDRIQTLKTLLLQSKKLKHGSLADEAAKAELNKWLSVVKNYIPVIYVIEMSIMEYNEFEKKLSGLAVQANFISKITTPDGVTLRYSYLKSEKAKDKAAAFIKDFENHIESTNGYSSDLEREDLELELSSFMQEFDPNILENFFPEWCSYFSSYHSIEDYCQMGHSL